MTPAEMLALADGAEAKGPVDEPFVCYACAIRRCGNCHEGRCACMHMTRPLLRGQRVTYADVSALCAALREAVERLERAAEIAAEPMASSDVTALRRVLGVEPWPRPTLHRLRSASSA